MLAPRRDRRDRFHVVRRIGEAVDHVRLRLQRVPRTPHAQTLYRLRYALHQPADTGTPAQQADLRALLAAYPELQLARQHWETFQAVYAVADRYAAEQALDRWERQLRDGGLPSFRPCAPPGRCWAAGVMNA